ncbi:MAG: hypothetical protein L0H37_08060 [Nitrosospira sp.]|nr:hypothetical protein [Nitrosospira sp.]
MSSVLTEVISSIEVRGQSRQLIEEARSVRQTVHKPHPSVQERIRVHLEERVAALENPRELGGPLPGALVHHWRFRIGNCRVGKVLPQHAGGPQLPHAVPMIRQQR